MTTIADVLRSHHDAVAATSSVGADDEVATVVARTRRRRRQRVAWQSGGVLAVAASFAVGIAALSGLASQVPPATVEPSPSLPAEPATPQPSASGQHGPGHDPSMSDQDALLRASDPATGETWLVSAEPVPDPEWAGTAGAQCDWALLGHRDRRDILLAYGNCDSWFFEANADGSDPAVIAAPRPFEDPDRMAQVWGQPTIAMSEFPVVRVDTVTTYDSLALPRSWEADDGTTVQRDGTLTYATIVGASDERTVTMDRAFGSQWFARIDAEAANFYTSDLFAQEPSLVFTDRREAVALPVGGVFFVYLASPMSDAMVRELTTVGGISPRQDFFGIACGTEQGPTGVLLATGDGSAWEPAGNYGGQDVFRPTQASPLGRAMYDAWLHHAATIGADAGTAQDYLSAPALLAWPSADGTGWWLIANDELSLIEWC